MPTDLERMTSPSASAMTMLDLARLQLQHVAERLFDAAMLARRLGAATDWQTPSARAFFSVAQRLVLDVSGLGPAAEMVMSEISYARTRMAMKNLWDGQ